MLFQSQLVHRWTHTHAHIYIHGIDFIDSWLIPVCTIRWVVLRCADGLCTASEKRITALWVPHGLTVHQILMNNAFVYEECRHVDIPVSSVVMSCWLIVWEWWKKSVINQIQQYLKSFEWFWLSSCWCFVWYNNCAVFSFCSEPASFKKCFWIIFEAFSKRSFIRSTRNCFFCPYDNITI